MGKYMYMYLLLYLGPCNCGGSLCSCCLKSSKSKMCNHVLVGVSVAQSLSPCNSAIVTYSVTYLSLYDHGSVCVTVAQSE